MQKKVSARNKWMQRWASRWRVEQGRFKQGDRLPLEVMRAKARVVRLWAIILDSLGHKIWVPCTRFWDKNSAQILGAKIGPSLLFS